MDAEERKAFRAKRQAELRSLFPIPYLQTDTSLHLTDGFATDRLRRVGYAKARRAGIDPNGKTFMPGMADKRGFADPAAWVPQHDFRSTVKSVCRERGYACDGTVTVGAPGLDEDPNPPYKPSPSMVAKDVEQINQTEHGGQMTPYQKREKHEQLTEQYAGNQ
jgi:hypothetical protein